MTRRAAVLLGIALAAVLFGAGVYALWPTFAPAPAAAIGGPFSLTDQDGRAVTERDLLGRPTAIFFGFTFCPEVCPTTLANLSAWLKALGPDGDRLNVVFVTIDPARDTPARLKAYLSAFDPRIRGLTGSDQAIAKVADEYRVYYRKVPLDGGGYTMDHSSAIYLMDASGRFTGPIAYGAPAGQGLASLRRLLNPAGAAPRVQPPS
jgi:protein SCO1